jgi:hypothetical protein
MFRLVFACAVALALGGCATVTRGTDDQIQVNSDPQGATVQTSLSQQCMTPCTLKVGRKDEFSVTVAKPGYAPQTVFVGTKVAGAGAAGFAGNVLVGGVIGMGVDAATGATLEHFPNPVTVILQRSGSPPSPQGPQRGRGKPPAVAQRPPAPPDAAVVRPTNDANSGAALMPPISDADESAFRRN